MDRPKIRQTRSTFSMACRVEANIAASPAIIWGLLTDAQDFPHWNSTVTRIDGQIREGERIRVHAPGTDRTFTPTVSGVVPDRRMAWIGGSALMKGVRTFDLKPRSDGSTDFVMQESFSGLLLPLARRSMPDFGPIYARYADDLKRAAEAGQARERQATAA
ncbi:MAG TPA: SRPBCC domain-containing protein [Thermoleophilia bacterium]|nr:SRPBCC domain-containing protein [Thermoleophilia bacterium]